MKQAEILAFIEARLAGEPEQNRRWAEAIRVVVKDILDLLERSDDSYDLHGAEEIAAGKCTGHVPERVESFRAIASIWRGHAGYQERWGRPMDYITEEESNR